MKSASYKYDNLICNDINEIVKLGTNQNRKRKRHSP